jgi:hypothetical protein
MAVKPLKLMTTLDIENTAQATFSGKQEQANRIEGQFDALREKVEIAGSENSGSDAEAAAMRTQMATLSSQYFDLTGLTLK